MKFLSSIIRAQVLHFVKFQKPHVIQWCVQCARLILFSSRSKYSHYYSRKQNKFLSIIQNGLGVERGENISLIISCGMSCAAINIGKICAQKVTNLFRSEGKNGEANEATTNYRAEKRRNSLLAAAWKWRSWSQWKFRSTFLRRDGLIKIPLRKSSILFDIIGMHWNFESQKSLFQNQFSHNFLKKEFKTENVSTSPFNGTECDWLRTVA